MLSILYLCSAAHRAVISILCILHTYCQLGKTFHIIHLLIKHKHISLTTLSILLSSKKTQTCPWKFSHCFARWLIPIQGINEMGAALGSCSISAHGKCVWCRLKCRTSKQPSMPRYWSLIILINETKQCKLPIHWL